MSEDDVSGEYLFDTNDTDISDLDSSECMISLIRITGEIGKNKSILSML